MKTIKIEIEVTEKEYALLVMARSEQPHPSRIKRMLLTDCASRLKRMANDVLVSLDRVDLRRHAGTNPNEMGWLDESNVRRIKASDELKS